MERAGEEAPQTRRLELQALALTPTHPATHTQLHGSPGTPNTFSRGCQKKQSEKSSQPGEKLKHPTPEASSFKSEKGKIKLKEKKKKRKKERKRSNAEQIEEPQRGTSLRPRELRMEVAAAGPGSVVPWLGPAAGRPSCPPAPAGSMNESAWK